MYHISANAGLEGAVIINKVRESAPGIGFDASNRRICRYGRSWYPVTRLRLQEALCRMQQAVASTLLTTESVVANIKEDAPAMPAGNPGMGMM